MRLLLDTSTLLWFLWSDAKLPDTAREIIEDPQHPKLVSVATCWEISIKVSIGKLRLGEPASTFLPRELVRNNFELLPISLAHVARVETLPFHHRDPFDRLLIAQALCDRLPVVTSEPLWDHYGISRVW